MRNSERKNNIFAQVSRVRARRNKCCANLDALNAFCNGTGACLIDNISLSLQQVANIWNVLNMQTSTAMKTKKLAKKPAHINANQEAI